MKQGNLNVKTENIFPIIKQFLYTDQEIFLRELVSNAVDATQKLKTLVSSGKLNQEAGDLFIEVKLDTKANTLTISDKGIGMTSAEVDKYINQIAFSSAGEFIEKYKKNKDQNAIIGHFGLGFYSAFMVADKVELKSKTYKENVNSVEWSCTNDAEFNIGKGDKKERGTDVILYLNEEAIKEYANEARIQTLLDKYCKFMPVEIKFKNETINDTSPAWLKQPTELTTQDYKDFYQKLYPFSSPPLFWIHLNVDYPFKLTGILYFPKADNPLEIQKNKIQLYSNQVFVTHTVDDIVPEFLTLLHGVIDSPDIPLNVSRSSLQADSNVKKISSYIVRKAAEKLNELFKEDRKEFEKKWKDISIFIKYGMLTDEKFAEKAGNFFLFENTNGEFFSIDEYKEKIKENQTDKEGKLVLLYTNNADAQHSYIEAANKRTFDIVKLEHPIDSHFVSHLESKLENVSIKRVDSDTLDNLVSSDVKKESPLNKEQEKILTETFKNVNNNPDNFNINTDVLTVDDPPVIITQNEFERRMREIGMMSGMGQFSQQMPEKFNLVLNTAHPLVKRLCLLTDENERNNLAKHAFDLARLSQNMLKGKEMTEFIRKTGELLAK